jgi:aspartyl-tRNA(Asn)/glutamyl-tRNA(Gln) amidotransferase subunit B
VSGETHTSYEVVIGLEVHTQLRTESKLFCGCRVRYGDDPNHHACPVCLALPGALPVLNARAVEFGVRTALATNCTVHPRSVFARKNYFYPDLPKGYQISQYEEPLATNGWIEIDGEEAGGRSFAKRVGITRIHMEEDAGKSIHDPAVTGRNGSHVDLNRAGVPLLEIVSEPDLRSPAEAGAYLRTLRQLLRYVDVSDADMEKGHFRCDANVSLRKKGGPLGIRNEIKNLNSFRYVEDALHTEIERQARVLDDGGRIIQATRLYDAATGKTRVMRTKENADDYRYFPDPDLVPLALEPAFVERARLTLPELPERRRIRFESEHGLSAYDARLLSVSRSLADFFEAVVQARVPAKLAANWILRDVLQALKEREQEIEETKLAPGALAALLRLVEEGRITAKSARELLPELVERGGDPAELVSARGLEAVSDSAQIERAAEEVIAAHPENAERFRAGEEKILNFLMGQVMKKTGGKASPGVVRDILARKLKA